MTCGHRQLAKAFSALLSDPPRAHPPPQPPELTVLSQTGRLNVAPDDDIDVIVEKIDRYLRLRNPLLDRKDFFCRNQEDGENINQYVASLIVIDNKLRCAYEDDIQTCCTQCGHAGDCRLNERRIRDWLIFGLRDPGMRRTVLLEYFGQKLTLDRVLQTCKAYKSSTDICLALAQESPAHLLAACRSAYKKATSEPPAPSPCANCGDGCHPRTQCKARKHFCGHCGKAGHFATVCRQKTQSLQQATLGHLELHQTGAIRDHLVSITVEINNDLRQDIFWLPDSGAGVDALSVQDFRLVSWTPISTAIWLLTTKLSALQMAANLALWVPYLPR